MLTHFLRQLYPLFCRLVLCCVLGVEREERDHGDDGGDDGVEVPLDNVGTL